MFDSTVSLPTEGRKTIESAFHSSDEVPKFSLINVINYFVAGTAFDGKAANDFKSINKSVENLFIVVMSEHCWLLVRISIGGLKLTAAQK